MGKRAESRATRRGGTLALLCVAQFVVILDTTIVTVALPSMHRDLGFADQAELQYVISLYALTFGGSLILAGRTADLFGRRRVFVAGLTAFTVASLICGLAPAPWALLAARAVQGAAGAMVSASALSLLTTLFTGDTERNRALGAWGAVGGAAGASGLIFGGALTALAGWPWVFFINAPVGLVTVLAARRVLPAAEASPPGARTLDLPGAVSVTGGLGLLIFGLTRGEQEGFTAGPTLGLLAAAVASLAVFVAVERRVRTPLVRFRLFRVPGVAAANLIALSLTTIIASNLFFTTLYVQRVLGFTALQTGLTFLPNSILVIVGSTAGSRLAGRFGAAAVLAGGLLVLGGSSLLLSGVPAEGGHVADVLPGFALTGFGLGLSFVSVAITATRGVAPDDQGLASGVLNTAQQVGFAVGIAAIVSVATAYGESAGDPAHRLVAGFSIGYLLDAALAGASAVLALFLLRERRAVRSRT
ncbi:MFS transporter [Spongiactinospora sp. 9N601]|uniref:MFS transporter n=1 Tax=Spongiactinospora sp. 9N601 TaxID=3375149 RepID=UPI0037949C60